MLSVVETAHAFSQYYGNYVGADTHLQIPMNANADQYFLTLPCLTII